MGMGSKQNEFSEDYLILKPKEASLVDVFLFILPLGSRRIRSLIDCPDAKEESYSSFKARCTIFVSILVQKFLLALAAPLLTLRAFLSVIQPLFFNYMIGKGEFYTRSDSGPEVRCRDWQIEDPDDKGFKYYGALTMMASQLAYEDYTASPSVVHSVVNGCWQMTLLGCFNFWNDFQNKATTGAFMFQNTAKDPNVTVVAFRGTSVFEASDWMVDFNISWYKIEGIGRIHSGFMQALGLQKATGWPKELPGAEHEFAYYTLRQRLRDIVKSNDKAKFIMTGHSLGGALATLFVTLLALHQDSTILQRLQAVYTFGQPRVGDKDFAEFMVNTVTRYGFKYYRYVYSFDLVPRVPFDSIIFKYKHFGGCLYFDCFYNGKFRREQPNTNYFSLIWVIPKYLSAHWELISSLIIIPVFKGREYFEGFVTTLERVVGLFFPGLSAHICPNYVNVTRWGKIKVLPDRNETLKLVRYIEADT
ncbi:Lipase, partial [Cucurbita argyrosperma subsp. sororia]